MFLIACLPWLERQGLHLRLRRVANACHNGRLAKGGREPLDYRLNRVHLNGYVYCGMGGGQKGNLGERSDWFYEARWEIAKTCILFVFFGGLAGLLNIAGRAVGAGF
jgi:hypothetical protein